MAGTGTNTITDHAGGQNTVIINARIGNPNVASMDHVNLSIPNSDVRPLRLLEVVANDQTQVVTFTPLGPNAGDVLEKYRRPGRQSTRLPDRRVPGPLRQRPQQRHRSEPGRCPGIADGCHHRRHPRHQPAVPGGRPLDRHALRGRIPFGERLNFAIAADGRDRQAAPTTRSPTHSKSKTPARTHSPTTRIRRRRGPTPRSSRSTTKAASPARRADRPSSSMGRCSWGPSRISSASGCSSSDWTRSAR